MYFSAGVLQASLEGEKHQQYTWQVALRQDRVSALLCGQVCPSELLSTRGHCESVALLRVQVVTESCTDMEKTQEHTLATAPALIRAHLCIGWLPPGSTILFSNF